MDLIWSAGQRERRRILQDDEAYLYPARARIPKDGLVIGEHDLPDVVLEVDHTTDVRRGKLDLYAAWGFPEVGSRRRRHVAVPSGGARAGT